MTATTIPARALAAALLAAAAVAAEPPPPFPKTPAEMLTARQDIWAEAAIRQPGGPSYEFFRDLLRPLRYVDTDFRYYPITLSAPGAAVKGRLVSNGSAINALARQPDWVTEVGTPVHVHVGPDGDPFGGDLAHLDGPHYADGWLPIVRLKYDHGGASYGEEVFAAVDEPLAAAGAVVAKFDFPGKDRGRLGLRFELGYEMLTGRGGVVKDKAGKVYAAFDDGWEWNAARNLLMSRPDHAAGHVTIFTKPVDSAPAAAPDFYAKQRDLCERRWRDLLAAGVHLDIPEPLVQNAWRSLVVGNAMIAVGDRMHYSANNAYSHLYEGECGDATRAMMLFGQTADARRFIGPLLDFPRQDTRFHVGGHKLQMLAHYYLVTRDKEYMREKEPVWSKVIDLIVENRKKTGNGLVPPDRYAGDINRPVFSLSSNAACWRGLRDMAVVLRDLGQTERADQLVAIAKEHKAAILAAVAKSERKEVTPPFIPIALMAGETPFDPLTATQLGSYYDLMIPYVLGSDVFMGTERETWAIDYLRQHGGLAMGMIRSMPHQGLFNGVPGNNVLYGLRYMLTILRRDDVGHALAGFYGQLAQAMARDTFIGGEGSRLYLGDARGRSFSLPPNSAANAMFLQTLRYLLVQDWTDDAGNPHELRLLYGVPGRWLADGTALKFERMPTLFGPVSVRCRSRLSQGEVVVDVEAPPRAPAKWTVRLPLPPGWRVRSAGIDNEQITIDEGAVLDLTGKTGSFKVRYVVEKGG
ncbi:MAG TPA: hypothetical protein VGF55_31710 [Gemmataceae bacterium]|jgi:hypothetical protein